MAVVKNPLLSTDARGSTSGITYSFSRGGNTARRKAKPAVKRGRRIPSNRSLLGYISRRWGTITNGQRAQWEAYAIEHPGTDRFGDPFIMSGINAFQMLNHPAMRTGGSTAYQVTPPALDPISAVDAFYAVTGVGNPGEIDLTWTELGAGIHTDWWEIWMAGPFQSPGRVAVNNRFSSKAYIAGNVLLNTIADLAEGFWYWFQIRYLDEYGQKTAWVQAQATPMLTP